MWLIVDQKLIKKKTSQTIYNSGDILGYFSSDKVVQPFVCKKYAPMEVLRPGEDLQHFIFEPGIGTCVHKNNGNNLAEQNHVGSFILEGPDLRTNPFKGGGNDATQTSIMDQGMKIRYEPVKQLIIAWRNGLFMGLIGLIHEVLDREKLMSLIQNMEALF